MEGEGECALWLRSGMRPLEFSFLKTVPRMLTLLAWTIQADHVAYPRIDARAGSRLRAFDGGIKKDEYVVAEMPAYLRP